MLNFLKKAIMRISFYPRKSNLSGNATLYTRIVVNGKRIKTDFSTGIQCKPCEWDKQLKFLKGKHHVENNMKLEAIESELRSINSYLSLKFEKVSPEMIKSEFFKATSEQYITLLNYYKNWAFKQSKRKGIAKRTTKIFIARYNLLKSYLEYSSQEHILIENVKTKFTLDFVLWMKNHKGYKHNYTHKNIQMLKSVLKDAVMREVLYLNPLDNFSFKKETNKEFIYLEEEELYRLETKIFQSDRLQQVNDCFLIQSYTGLSYIDLKLIDFEKSIFFRDEKRWLKAKRQKTKIQYEIPLIMEAMSILEKYNFKLPVLSNQKYNSYLKEIAAILDIDKRLTTHVARKTAGMIWLNKYKISLEAVQKMLGHASIKTTEQFYAKVLSNRLSDEIKRALGDNW